MEFAILWGVMVSFKQYQPFRSFFRDKIGSLAVSMAIILIFPAISLGQFRSQVDIGLAGDVYMTRANVNNGQAHGALLIENKDKHGYFFADIGSGGLVGESGHSYIKTPQLYYRWGQPGQLSFTVGRLKNKWSLADDFWHMGLTQPLFLWDAARPETQGLTGLFLDIPSRSVDITLFASFLYLPTQGATYELSNGRLISSNPWFADPIEAVNFGDQRFNLNYEVEVPDATSIVFQTSAGLSIRAKEDSHTIFNAFYFFKPRNDLVLPFEGALNSSTLNGDIVVRPVVAQHHVAGLDLGLHFSSYSQAFFSWVYEGGIDFEAPDNTTFPDFSDQNMFAATTAFKLYNRHDLWLSYIHVERSVTTVRGVFGSSAVDTYRLRNRFEKALRLKSDFNLVKKPNGFYKGLLTLSYTFDTEDQGSWVSGLARWALTDYLSAYTQCDLFGGNDRVIVGDHFISRYQNNDRCILGGNYVF